MNAGSLSRDIEKNAAVNPTVLLMPISACIGFDHGCTGLQICASYFQYSQEAGLAWVVLRSVVECWLDGLEQVLLQAFSLQVHYIDTCGSDVFTEAAWYSHSPDLQEDGVRTKKRLVVPAAAQSPGLPSFVAQLVNQFLRFPALLYHSPGLFLTLGAHFDNDGREFL